MGALGSLKRRLQLPANLEDLGRNPQQGGGGLIPPAGFVFLTDIDGAYLPDGDGYYLLEAA